jgi:hypothetical protein
MDMHLTRLDEANKSLRADKQTNAQKDRQTDRQTDRHKDSRHDLRQLVREEPREPISDVLRRECRRGRALGVIYTSDLEQIWQY